MAIPSFIEGYGEVRPFTTAFAAPRDAVRTGARIRSQRPGQSKVLPSIREAIREREARFEKEMEADRAAVRAICRGEAEA